jgi:hypothetical protein
MNDYSKNNKPIHYYNRSQAIKDGVLFDVTGMTKSVGIKWHVAVTSAVWSNFIVWTDDDRRRQGLQETADRLWHIVFTLHCTMEKTDKHADIIFFELDILPRDGASYRVKLTKLKAVIGASDHFESVITIMLPNED